MRSLDIYGLDFLDKGSLDKLGGKEHTNLTVTKFFSQADKQSIYDISQTLLILNNVKRCCSPLFQDPRLKRYLITR